LLAAIGPPFGAEREVRPAITAGTAADERPISSKSRTTSSKDCDWEYLGVASEPAVPLLCDDACDWVEEGLLDTDMGRVRFLPVELDFAEDDTGRETDT
jgi:hypothetical protein